VANFAHLSGSAPPFAGCDNSPTMRAPLDTLTPREREVLALLRRGLTNEEIAQRLDISLDGAKYHVSQILSKLGVATREEAAAIAIGEPRRWWAAWPLWARIGGAATMAAAGAGVAVLAWGVLRTGGGDAETSAGLTPTAAQGAATVRSGMARYSNELLKVELDYPDTWVPDPGSVGSTGTATTYEDPRGGQFGWFSIVPCCSPDKILDDMVSLTVEQERRPYGEEPTILSMTLPDGEARLILPDPRHTEIVGGELIIRYPPSLVTDFYAYLLLYAHKDYIQDIAPTLRLTGSSASPTP
jgi:DNA-binding CsgD family transcriptional regulator